MKNNASLVYNLFLVIGDFLSLILAFIGAYILRVTLGLTFGSATVAHPVHASTYITIFLFLAPFWLFVFGLMGLYDSSIYEKRFAEMGRLFMGSFVGLLFVVSYAFASNEVIFPAKLVPVYGFVLAFLLLLLFRNLARLIRTQLFRYGMGITNLLIIGDTRVAHELIDSLHNSRVSGYKIVGVVGRKYRLDHPARLKIFNDFEHAKKVIGPEEIHSIVQTELFSAPEKNDEILSFAQANHIAYRFIPGNTELFVGNIDVELFRSSIPVIAVHQTALLGWGRIVKRIFDVVVGGILLVIALPFIGVISLLLLLFGGGSVFFRQTRLTRFNQRFVVFKFRTLKKKFNGLTPEQAFRKMGQPELIEQYRTHGDQIPYDPRFSRLGRFLRRTSLDELPQLFNIVKGDLSLVGPRALVPEELSIYEKRHAILSVKSGLTGLAQVSGRRDITFDERRQLDMYYVQNWSFWLDLVILAKTIRVILRG
ncbi:MAG: Undecaprenyl-phosphate galactose phosphotransferase [Candidatus Saccharibacteria bacterium]|nr:Undecaprenyl-phosphate galactose phosphotransferase [Candidatus Saccharibacteria bacterium]